MYLSPFKASGILMIHYCAKSLTTLIKLWDWTGGSVGKSSCCTCWDHMCASPCPCGSHSCPCGSTSHRAPFVWPRKAVESYHKPWEPALTWQIQNCLLTLEQLSFGCCSTWEENGQIEDLAIIFLSIQRPLQ